MYISIDENVKIEFDRFYSAAKFNSIDLPEGLRDLLETLEANVIQEYDNQIQEISEESWENGHDNGRDIGYDEGYFDGKDVGYDEGYIDAEKEAYESGFKDGYDQAVRDSND